VFIVWCVSDIGVWCVVCEWYRWVRCIVDWNCGSHFIPSWWRGLIQSQRTRRLWGLRPGRSRSNSLSQELQKSIHFIYCHIVNCVKMYRTTVMSCVSGRTIFYMLLRISLLFSTTSNLSGTV